MNMSKTRRELIGRHRPIGGIGVEMKIAARFHSDESSLSPQGHPKSIVRYANRWSSMNRAVSLHEPKTTGIIA